MKRVNPKAVWVIQGWTENPRPEMVDQMKTGDLLVLDLFSECRPMFGAPSIWRRAEGYKQHQWLFCLLQNFGANVGLHGRMDQLIENFCLATGEYQQNLKGFGFTMEGSENNPVMYELMSELPWRYEDNSTWGLTIPKEDEFITDIWQFKENWINAYVKARYGVEDPAIKEAWKLLSNTIYNCPAGNNQQGPHESIFCGRPSLNNFQASSWSKMKNYYDPAATLKAAQLFLKGASSIFNLQSSISNNLEYDLVDITRQALADQARLQYQHTIADYKAFNIEGFKKNADRFLKMLLLQDRLLGTRSEFRLGHWTQAAINCGTTAEEKKLYEWNARVQITTWGNRYCADTGGLRDYAHKEWQGLLKDFYYPRWKAYFDALLAQMEAQTKPQPELLGGGPNANKTSAELFAMALPQEVKIDWYAMEEPWTKQQNTYTAEPQGNALEEATEIMDFLTK
jgi:alpha-N-acetylglucosaminidase